MTDRYITISEAEKFTGKSRSTLRRFLDGIVKVENAPDRQLIVPTVEEVVALRKQSQPFSWKISEQLLRRQFLKPEETETARQEQGSGGVAEGNSSRLIAVLEKSITLLERELAEKNGQMAAMNERLRESNILMKDFQARLPLPAPITRDDGKVTDASVDSAATRGHPQSRKPTRRPFGWLFGK